MRAVVNLIRSWLRAPRVVARPIGMSMCVRWAIGIDGRPCKSIVIDRRGGRLLCRLTSVGAYWRGRN